MDSPLIVKSWTSYEYVKNCPEKNNTKKTPNKPTCTKKNPYFAGKVVISDAVIINDNLQEGSNESSEGERIAKKKKKKGVNLQLPLRVDFYLGLQFTAPNE